MLTVQSKGERALVEYALHLIKKSRSTLLPPGDDAAAIPLEGRKALVLKTDFLTALTDIPPGMTARQVGWKAVTMNISDLAAKGARPLATLFSLGLPRDYSFEGARELVSALFEASSFYGAENLGGDTGESEGLLIAGMAVGLAEREELMRRDGAKPGDILAVTGDFGYTSLGLKFLLGHRKARGRMAGRAVDSVYNPRARLKEGLALGGSRTVTSSTDSSDGLAWSLHELSEASKVGFILDSLPIAGDFSRYVRGIKFDPFDLVFYGGEEYELVVTVRRRDWPRAEGTMRRAGGRLVRIGKATRKRSIIWTPRSGRERVVEPRGYEHFRETH